MLDLWGHCQDPRTWEYLLGTRGGQRAGSYAELRLLLWLPEAWLLGLLKALLGLKMLLLLSINWLL